MANFNTSCNRATKQTGQKYLYKKTDSRRGGDLVAMTDDGTETVLMSGTKAEAEKFLDGIAYAAMFMKTPEQERKTFEKVQREYDIEDIKNTADALGIHLTKKQIEYAADYYVEHYNCDVSDFFQRETAIEEAKKATKRKK